MGIRRFKRILHTTKLIMDNTITFSVDLPSHTAQPAPQVTIENITVDPREPSKAWQKLQLKVQKTQLDPLPDERSDDKIRLVLISDTHGSHSGIEHIPDGDILIHSGDITGNGRFKQLDHFNKWINDLPHKHKIVIAGNHDITLEDGFYESNGSRWHGRRLENFQACRDLFRQEPNFTYLEDQAVTVEGYKFY